MVPNFGEFVEKIVQELGNAITSSVLIQLKRRIGFLDIFGSCEANGTGFRAIGAILKRLFEGLSLWVLGTTRRFQFLKAFENGEDLVGVSRTFICFLQQLRHLWCSSYFYFLIVFEESSFLVLQLNFCTCQAHC